MISRREKVRVGLFLIACAAIATAAILLLAGLLKAPTVEYTAVFEEYISGLDEASPVKYQGKRVGKVANIVIDSETGLPLVTMAIEERYAPEVKEDTVSTIQILSYAAGTKCVELSRGSPGASQLKPGSRIPSKVSWFAKVDELGLRASKAFENVANLADETMRETVHRLLGTIDRAVGQSAERLARTADGVEADLGTLKRTLETVEALVGENRPAVSQSIASLEEAIRSLRDIAEQVHREELVVRATGALSALELAALSIGRLTDRVDVILARNLGAIDETLENLRQATRDLAEAARTIRERPSLLLRDLPRAEKELPD